MNLISKKDILIFIIILLFAFTITYPLIIQMHFAPDTYQVVVLGYKEYAKQYFLKSGRIITAGSFFIADSLNISYKAYIIFMEVVAIIALTLSTILLYKLFLKKIGAENNAYKYLLLASSFLIIFNPFALEFLLYAESGIICLSILFSIIGLRILFGDSKHKYLKALSLVIVATILYQGNVNIFFTLSVIFSFIVNKENGKQNWKDTIKYIFLAGTILVIAFITTTLLIFVCTNLMNVKQERFSDIHSINLAMIFKSFISVSVDILINGFNFIYKGIFFYTIIVTLFYIAIKTRLSYLVKYFLTIFAALSVCILPIYTMKDVFINARMCMSIGAIIGISFVYIAMKVNYNNKIEKSIVAIAITAMILYTGYNYITISQSNIEENKIDNEVGYKIKEIVQNYEKEKNIKITKVAVTNDINRSFYTSKQIENTFTERSTANYYCIKEVIEYYLQRPIVITDMDKETYDSNFKDRNWDEFSEEQIIFKDNIMYMCIY